MLLLTEGRIVKANREKCHQHKDECEPLESCTSIRAQAWNNADTAHREPFGEGIEEGPRGPSDGIGMAEIKISPKELVLVRKTRDIMLEHRGKENAIHSRELSRLLGIKEGDTFIKVRSIVDKVIRRYGLPIAGDTHAGYFIIVRPNELTDYIGSLEGRKLEIENKKNIVFQNYLDHYGSLEVRKEE